MAMGPPSELLAQAVRGMRVYTLTRIFYAQSFFRRNY
jgi:hypothetical protein